MTKIKKKLLILPLLLLLILSSFLFVACNENDDQNAIYVNSVGEINNAIISAKEDEVIKLKKDIEMEKEGDSIIPILVYPANKNYDLTIDLNGHNINTYFRIVSKNNNEETNYNVNLTIKNSKKSGGLIGFNNNEFYYAFVILTNNNFNIELENITAKAQYAGIYTNGSYNGNTIINAEECNFISTHTNTLTSSKDGGMGVYLASKNFTYNFKECYFEGYTAYFTKHGTHNLENCTFVANGTQSYSPAYYGNGGSVTGSALYIESSSDYKVTEQDIELKVFVKGGSFTSLSNYAIEEASTAQEGSEKICYASISITKNPSLNGEGDKTIYTENNLID